jgi:hypothetical protein
MRAATPVIEWGERHVCSKRSSREVNPVMIGTEPR